MDIYKLKFTILQEEILRFMFIHAGESFNARSLAKHLKVSPTAIANSLPLLNKENLLDVKKDKESNTLSILLNRENIFVTQLKRSENLKMLYESKLIDNLSDEFPGCTMILFGSFSYGTDASESDIDIAIIGTKKDYSDLTDFEKILCRRISLNFYENFKKIDKNLKENIFNGIVLNGAIEL